MKAFFLAVAMLGLLVLAPPTFGPRYMAPITVFTRMFSISNICITNIICSRNSI